MVRNKHFLKSMMKKEQTFMTEQDIEEGTYNYKVISNTLDFAKMNSIRVCCEGVETARELTILESCLPDLIQGYLFDKPCEVNVRCSGKRVADSDGMIVFEGYHRAMGDVEEVQRRLYEWL